MTSRQRGFTPSVFLPLLLGAAFLGLIMSEPARIREPVDVDIPMPVDPLPDQVALRSIELPAPPPLSAVSIAPTVPSAVVEGGEPLKPVAKPPAPEVPTRILTPSPPRQAAEEQPTPENAPMPEKMIDVDASLDMTDMADGRIALRLLEHGRGPEIEIAWPDDRATQSRLYDRLSRCQGMKTVLMNASGLIFDDRSTRSGSAPDLDRYSGFARQARGALPPREAEAIQRLRKRFEGLPGLAPVRLFPRGQDAVLLGGLMRLAGSGYKTAARIEARYSLDGQSVLITGIRVDGRMQPGAIRFPGGGSCLTGR